MQPNDRLRLAFIIRYAMRHPGRIVPHARRLARDAMLRLRNRDHMKPGGFFDFTFDRTEGAEHHVLREDFYYRTETLVVLPRRHGLAGQFMKDWEELPHPQSKLRVTAGPSE